MPQKTHVRRTGSRSLFRNARSPIHAEPVHCDRYGLTVTVSHYPPGASKWNPIEHRLFSEISKNWAGKPLDSYRTVLNYIRTTKTATGLETEARLSRKRYKKGEKVPESEMKRLALSRHEIMPNWNYTVCPRKCEVISE